MEANGAAARSTRIEAADKLYMENTLLRVAGALFCHDAKRAPTRTDEIQINRGVTEKNIVIRPDPRLGQPGPLAHRIFVALIKKHSGYGKPIQTDISFTKRELMRLIGREHWGGSASEQLTRALNEIHHAFVRTSFKTAENRHAEHSFTIFPEIYLERAASEKDPIETCVVTLARPIIASLQDDHFTCLNHALMQQLGTIGQALYMRLFFHFANLYDGHHKNRLTFPKRYEDICEEWLGGLTARKHRSSIERDQLGPHLRQLVQVGFLASYHIAPASRGEGFVIGFRPGAAFFDDYERFYRRRHQGGLQFEFHADQREITEPLKVAYLFIEKRTGETIKNIPYVSSNEVQTARQLLACVPFEEIGDFLSFALAEATKTRFDVRSLGGVRQYLDPYLRTRQERGRAKAAQAAHEAAEGKRTDRQAYDRYCRERADALFENLPADERTAIEQLARSKGRSPFGSTGSIAELMYRIDRARITIERHPRQVPSFEEWRVSRRRGLSAAAAA
jgi:Replication initiator protein A